jgi:DNA-directed RNA polymerase sigma subunit (sigma70/sigma32)
MLPRAAPLDEGNFADAPAPRQDLPHDPGLDLYVREVERQPPLTVEEEEGLIRRLRGGDRQARETLVYRSLRLVPRVGRQFAGRGLSLLQLIERGNVGLLGAVEAYAGGDQPLPFYVYAVEQIERAMTALIRSAAPIQ